MARRLPIPLALLVAVSVGSAALPAFAMAQRQPTRPAPDITAKSAIVVEPESGDLAFASNPDERRPIASTTKLMTTLITLERVKDLNQRYAAIAYNGQPVETMIGLHKGEQMSVADLLRATLIGSANDAAATLAKRVGGTKPAFVQAMNKRAQELGLKNTHYDNPVGLDGKTNYSSARDLVTLAQELRKFPFFRETVALPSTTLQTGAMPRTIKNTNGLMAQHRWITGIKTGHTSAAGYVLVGSGTRKGVTLLSAVLGSTSESGREQETLELLRWASAHYKHSRVVKEGEVLARVSIRYRMGAKLNLVAQHNLRITTRRGDSATIRTKGVPEEVDGPIRAGQRFGTIEVLTPDKRTLTVPLVAADAVPEAGFGQKVKDWFAQPIKLLLTLLAAVGIFVLVQYRRRKRRRLRKSSRSRPKPEVQVS